MNMSVPSLSSLAVLPLSVIAVLHSIEANAGLRFDCYADPGKPISAFQYSNGQCGTSGPAVTGRDLANGNHQIVCTVPAVCGPVPSNLRSQPEPLTVPQIQERIARNLLRSSMLMCRGTADYNRGMIAGNIQCPAPSRCRDDVFYNLAFAGTVAVPDPIAGPRRETPEDQRQ